MGLHALLFSVQFATVPKNILVLCAGLVWCAAGANVFRIGIRLLWPMGLVALDLAGLALVVFLTFYLLIFMPTVRRHVMRLRQHPASHLPAWMFFDARSYAVMAVMMGGGMWLRLSQAVPAWAIAFFYSGLGAALFAAGTHFFASYRRGDVMVEGRE